MALLVAAAVSALPIDMAVANFWKSRKTPSFIVDVFESAETFGNGAGVLWLLAFVAAVGAAPGRVILRLGLASLGSGLLADACKLLVLRTRPRDLTTETSILETFGQWLPALQSHPPMQSFPSAHAATAVGLAYALGYFFPRGRMVFAFFACLVVLQRLQTGAHFVSDTLAGAALGLVLPIFLFRVGPTARWFERFEPTGGSTPAGPSVPGHHLPVELPVEN